MHRTIAIKHDANTIKVNAILRLLPHWQHALHAYSTRHKQHFQQGTPIPKYAKTKARDVWFNTELSARQLKSAHTQAYKAWKSYEALLENEIRTKITRSTLSKEDKTELYRINKQHAWYTKGLHLDWLLNEETGELKVPNTAQRKNPQSNIVHLPASPELQKLARNMIKHARNQPPQLNKCRTMEMDGIICERQENKTSSYDQWLRVSTLEKGKPSYVPLLKAPYFETLPGKVVSMVQVTVSEEGDVRFSLIKEADNAGLREGDNPVFLDANFSDNLFATAKGDLLGAKAVTWLKEMDDRVTKRGKWLQKRGIPLKKDKQYKSLTKRIKDFIENEINRIVNKLVADPLVTEIVFEKLDFRSPGLSKRMNRLLGRMGRRVFNKKMARIAETHGVKSTAFNPAYSSQQCSVCGFVSRANRGERSSFKCKCCSNRLHADVNAARVLEARRSSSLGGNTDPFAFMSVRDTRALLISAHVAGCGACGSLNHVAGVGDSGGAVSGSSSG